MKKAFFIIAAVMVGLTLASLLVKNPNASPVITLSSVPIEIFFAWLSVYLIRIGKGGSVRLTIWGYVWRAFVARIFSMFFSVVLSIFLLPRPVLPSLVFTLQLYIFMLVVMPVATWLFFSNNRLDQLKRVKTLVVGE